MKHLLAFFLVLAIASIAAFSASISRPADAAPPRKPPPVEVYTLQHGHCEFLVFVFPGWSNVQTRDIEVIPAGCFTEPSPPPAAFIPETRI